MTPEAGRICQVTVEIAVHDEQEAGAVSAASHLEEDDAVSAWLRASDATPEEVEARRERLAKYLQAAAEQGREHGEAFWSLCENVKIIGDMVMDVSRRFEVVEGALEALDTKVDGIASGGTHARNAWSQRREAST